MDKKWDKNYTYISTKSFLQQHYITGVFIPEGYEKQLVDMQCQ